ncbi:MAG TPA: hypothetical protein VMU51_09550 [Mycobacteriales bacterium]|nr:hypothetical protein [Mycobacteriales bacterium]
MTSPTEPSERALAAAFAPPGEVYVCPTAGVRLRARAVRRRTELATHAVAVSLLAITLVALTGSAVVRGRQPEPTLSGAQAVQQGAPPPVYDAGTQPLMPYGGDARSATPLGPRYGASALTYPLKLIPAAPADGRRCLAVRMDRSDCYQLAGQPVLVVHQLAAAVMTSHPRSATSELTLTLWGSDTAAYSAYTSRSVGDQIAYVVGDQTWLVAPISRPVTNGVIELAAGQSTQTTLELIHSFGLSLIAEARGKPAAV